MKYVDTFKHVKFLNRRERTTYFPKALRVIRALVDIGVLLGIDVTSYLGVLLDRVERISLLLLSTTTWLALLSMGLVNQ